MRRLYVNKIAIYRYEILRRWAVPTLHKKFIKRHAMKIRKANIFYRNQTSDPRDFSG